VSARVIPVEPHAIHVANPPGQVAGLNRSKLHGCRLQCLIP